VALPELEPIVSASAPEGRGVGTVNGKVRESSYVLSYLCSIKQNIYCP